MRRSTPSGVFSFHPLSFTRTAKLHISGANMRFISSTATLFQALADLPSNFAAHHAAEKLVDCISHQPQDRQFDQAKHNASVAYLVGMSTDNPTSRCMQRRC